MLLVPIVVLLVQTFAVQANMFGRMHEKGGDDIKALCKGKEFNLSRFAQLKQLALGLNSKCELQTNQTVTKLVEIYEHNKEDLCTMSHVSDLRSYYEWGLQTFLYPISSDDEPKGTVSFNRFVVAYGLQVSNLCKSNMLEELTGEKGGRKLAAMNEEAMELFGQLTSDTGPVGRLLGDLGNREEPIMPGDLATYLKMIGYHDIPILKPAMRVRRATLNFIDRVKSQCQQTYRPIYGPYMMPLVELTNLGLSYRDQELESKLENLTIAKEIGCWSRIAYTCATLEQFHIKEKPETTTISMVSDGTIPVAVDSRELEEIRYEPHTKVTLDEQASIYDKSDGRLVEAVKSAYISPNKKYLVGLRMAKKTTEVRAKKLELGKVGRIVIGTRLRNLSWLIHDRCTDTGYLVEALDQMSA